MGEVELGPNVLYIGMGGSPSRHADKHRIFRSVHGDC